MSTIDQLKTISSTCTDQKPCKVVQTVKGNCDQSILPQLPSTSALRQVVYREKKRGKRLFHEPKDIYFTIQHAVILEQ